MCVGSDTRSAECPRISRVTVTPEIFGAQNILVHGILKFQYEFTFGMPSFAASVCMVVVV